MDSLKPLSPVEFDALVGLSATNRRVMQHRGQIHPLIVPTKKMVADGLWPTPCYLPADALIFVAIEKFVKAGATRAAIEYAAADIQTSVIDALDRLHAGENVELAFAHDGKRFAVVTGATVREAVHLVVDHFLGLGVADPSQLACQSINLTEALTEIRQRAHAADIAFPVRLWPTLDELDAMAETARRFSPKAAPAVLRWRAARASEAEAALRRDSGSLS